MAKLISFFGALGSGKTTYGRLLSSFLEIPLYSEQATSPFLKDMFLNKKHALLNQLHFLYTDRNQILDTIKNSEAFYTIFDYHIIQVEIFSRLFLNETEYKDFSIHYQKVTEDLPSPDLVICTNTNSELIKERIIKRGRTYEKDNLGVVQSIIEMIPKYIKTLSRTADVYVINSDRDIYGSLKIRKEVLYEMISLI